MTGDRQELAAAVTESPDGTWVDVRVIPRAARFAVTGVRGDVLVIRLPAPPVDGAANDALTMHVARWLGISRRRVTIVKGLKSRQKRLLVEGLPAARVLARLCELPPD